jgi:hypothetical protein
VLAFSGVLLLYVNLLSLGSHDEHLGNLVLEDVRNGDECLHLHSGLLRLAFHDEHLGELVLVLDPVGGECRRLQHSACTRRAPQTGP